MSFCQLHVIFLQPLMVIFPHKAQLIVNMIYHRRVAKTSILSIVLFLSFITVSKVNAQDGKALFSANCATCHKIDQQLTGPALLGVEAPAWAGVEATDAMIQRQVGPVENQNKNNKNKSKSKPKKRFLIPSLIPTANS